MTHLAYCYHCANYTQCGVYGRDERVLCEECRPKCTECGLPRYERTETTLCIDCEIKQVYDLAEKGELTQSETFEWIHELEEARRAA